VRKIDNDNRTGHHDQGDKEDDFPFDC